MIDTMKYLELAVSKDATRYNMTSIFRDHDCMVATDGYRLHRVSGLPRIDKPHLLDGSDHQFPNYDYIMPKETQPLIRIKWDKAQIKQLKAYVAFTGKATVSRLQYADNHLVIQCDNKLLGAAIRFPVERHYNNFADVGIKAAQWADAIITETIMTLSRGIKDHDPMVLEAPHLNTLALLMPCKLD